MARESVHRKLEDETVSQDTSVPASAGAVTGTLRVLIGRLFNLVKGITGKPNAWDAPATTLEAAATHISASNPHTGSASTSAATETAPGIVELATSAETTTGTSTTLATHPAGVKAVADTKVPTSRTISTTAPLTGGGDLTANRTLAVSSATETAEGVAERASTAEADAGTDTTRYMSPLLVQRRFDLIEGLLNFSRADVAITGATTLTSSAFGKAHICSGTTADYTITLPPVAGNAGKLITFIMSNALTKLVTLDGNAAELIDGSATRAMWARETATLYCDGASWTKVAGKSRAFTCKIRQTVAQSVADATVTQIVMDSTDFDDSGLMADLANNQIKVPRANKYLFNAYILWATGTVVPRVQTSIRRNAGGAFVSSEGNAYSTASHPVAMAASPRDVVAGDTIDMTGYHATGATRNTYATGIGNQAFLAAMEITSW